MTGWDTRKRERSSKLYFCAILETPYYTASAGRYAPRLYCLFDLIVLAVVGLAGGAGEAQVRPCDAAACRPDGRAADHAPCAVFLGGEGFPRCRDQLPAVGVLVVFLPRRPQIPQWKYR